jgi:hypothetical protein
MKTSRFYKLLVLILILRNGIVLAQPSYYPPPSSILYQNDTLTIFPPDSLPGEPVVLLSYNIYVDNEFYNNIQVPDPVDVVTYFLDDESLLPGTRIFCVAAVYNEWISDNTCDTATIIYGYELPFYEDWSSGSFETLQWNTTSDHWVIESDEGNPAPGLAFLGEPGLTNYEAVLESYPVNAVGTYSGKIWLDFDLKLQCINSTNEETLQIQIWKHSSQSWTTCAEYFNGDGSFNWEPEHINIKSQSMNKVFKVRFVATGENSQDISAWEIDNIHIYRNCIQPTDLVIEENLDYNSLDWFSNIYYWEDWLHWDDGQNSGNSIGLNDTAEFDVAARWIPSQLTSYNGCNVYEISFFPAEPAASYSIRVWSGSGPDTLILDQPVSNPVMYAWNNVIVTSSVYIDATKDLWVGYHVSTTTGWPMGVDDGPGIDGFGNLFYFQDEWTTLLNIDPDLDYNWNIICHILCNPNGEDLYFDIYRSTNQQEFELYDVAYQQSYQDDNIDLTDYYCYKVTNVHINNSDTCESASTNIACEVEMLGTNEREGEVNTRIYPNPASTFLYIESSDKIKEVRIYNMLGECVLKLEIRNSENQIDVRSLKDGIYFIEVVAEGKIWKDKVLIIK